MTQIYIFFETRRSCWIHSVWIYTVWIRMSSAAIVTITTSTIPTWRNYGISCVATSGSIWTLDTYRECAIWWHRCWSLLTMVRSCPLVLYIPTLSVCSRLEELDAFSSYSKLLKTFLVTSNRAVDGIKFVRNGYLWSNVVLEKEVISHSSIKWLQAWSLLLGMWKHTTCVTSVFLFQYSLATLTTNWVKILTDLIFYAYVGIHQVRILVFDNYQRCWVPHKTFLFSETLHCSCGLVSYSTFTFASLKTKLVLWFVTFVEAKTYSCFCELMKRMSKNFPHGGAMDTHFANMRSLIQVGAGMIFLLL